MKCLPFRPKIAYQMVRVWDLGVEPRLKRLLMGVRPGFWARDETLGELRFNEGPVPGTKPFKSVFAQREFPQELVRNKETCTMYPNCLSPDSISRLRQYACTHGLNHICSHDNRNCCFSLEELEETKFTNIDPIQKQGCQFKIILYAFKLAQLTSFESKNSFELSTQKRA